MRKNLILISLDTVRADVAYSGKFKTIERLRKEGTTFLNAVASSPLTPCSHATVFTGLQPFHHGVRHLFKEKIAKKSKTITQYLKSRGYKTGAIVSCPGMNKWYGFSKGFDYYDDQIPRLADGSDPLKTVDVKKRGTALKRAEVVVKRSLQWLKKNEDKKFFLFIHFFDAHWPYKAPKKYGGNNKYEEEVAYSDHYLGVFLDTLRKAGRLKNTSLVCFSDHGEDLDGLYKNDKGGKKLGHPEEFGHGCLLYDQTQKVVFIIKDKKLPKDKKISQQVRLVDVAPTILDLFDIKYSLKDFDGISLISSVKKDKDLKLCAYSETLYPEEQTLATGGKFSNARNKVSFRLANKYKIIYEPDTGKQEFYDLESDPCELNNLSLL